MEILDTTGLKCPKPLLRIAVKAPAMKDGDVLEVVGDCPTFERDVRTWCHRLGKTLLFVREEGGMTRRAQIQF